MIKTFKYFSDKRFSTIAGTLVYFLLMSLTPFLLWLTLVGANMNLNGFFSNELFNTVRPVLHYMKSSAESAAGGAGIIFLLTSLYSATNFFYHLRRSGEIVYSSAKTEGGIKLRIKSLILIITFFALVFVLAGVSFLGTWFLDKFMPYYFSDIISYTFIAAVALLVAVVLNFFACPYKLKFSDVLSGSLLTTALWLVIASGFSVYMHFASPERLYGKLAFLIVFLLWSYVMMCCFVIGIIVNGSFRRDKIYKNLL